MVNQASLYSGMDVDDDVVYASEADGTIRAFSRFTGREVWKKETLLHRYPSAPAIVGDAIVIGDLEDIFIGYKEDVERFFKEPALDQIRLRRTVGYRRLNICANGRR